MKLKWKNEVKPGFQLLIQYCFADSSHSLCPLEHKKVKMHNFLNFFIMYHIEEKLPSIPLKFNRKYHIYFFFII